MKRIIIALAVIATFALVSCSSKEEKTKVDLKTGIKTCSDPDSLRNVYLPEAKAHYAELIQKGDTEGANAFLEEIKTSLSDKLPLDANFIDYITGKATDMNFVIEDGNAVVTETSETITEKIEDASNNAENIVENGVDKVNQVAETGINTAKETVNDTKSKVENEVKDAKNKVENEVQKGKDKMNKDIQDAKNKLNKAL